jgi:predicted RNase H-like nuclease (RuvC/YqgF family)
VSSTRQPGDTPPAQDPPAVSEAAERARERLHQEIERVRAGVEEMLAEQDAGGSGAETTTGRRELDELREEMRSYVKRRVRKSERRISRSIEKVEERTAKLEKRLDTAEEERRYAEWRIHTNTEAMLDSLLREIRTIGDLLSRR